MSIERSFQQTNPLSSAIRHFRKKNSKFSGISSLLITLKREFYNFRVYQGSFWDWKQQGGEIIGGMPDDEFPKPVKWDWCSDTHFYSDFMC